MTRGQAGDAAGANTALELVALKPDFRVMNETDASASEPEDAFAAAEQRLKRALGAIESRFKALQARAEAAKGDEAVSLASEEDRARLADELDAARAREAALSEAAGEASAACGEAIAELRAILGRDAGPGEEG